MTRNKQWQASAGHYLIKNNLCMEPDLDKKSKKGV